MRMVKVLFGFLPGVTLGMWLKAMWLCVSIAICNPADDCAWWVIVALIVNLLVSGLLVVRDREKWRRVCEKINSL